MTRCAVHKCPGPWIVPVLRWDQAPEDATEWVCQQHWRDTQRIARFTRLLVGESIFGSHAPHRDIRRLYR